MHEGETVYDIMDLAVKRRHPRVEDNFVGSKLDGIQSVLLVVNPVE